jgi:6-phospho-3-hexuloisomerase
MKTLVSTIASEIQGVLGIFDYAALDEFAERLHHAGHVLVAGEGRSGFMAKAFAMRLMHLGLHVHVVGETTTPALRDGDLLVAVSGSGTTATTVRTAEQASAVGASVVAVTTDPEAPLAARADAVVQVPAATKYRKPGEAATIQPLSSLFDQVCHIVFDAVCLRLALLRDVDNASARAAHANTE